MVGGKKFKYYGTSIGSWGGLIDEIDVRENVIIFSEEDANGVTGFYSVFMLYDDIGKIFYNCQKAMWYKSVGWNQIGDILWNDGRSHLNPIMLKKIKDF